MDSCTLCGSKDPARITTRHFMLFQCSSCCLLFKDAVLQLPEEQEKARYKLHQNSVNDKGYMDFLGLIISSSMKFLSLGMQVLDYGSGPVPALSQLLEMEGYSCQLYDPFFHPVFPDEAVDYIFCTEVVEHFRDPVRDFVKMDSILKSGSYLALMTAFYPEDLYDWKYLNDTTHLSFYQYETFKFICLKFKYEIVYTDHKRVIILRKS